MQAYRAAGVLPLALHEGKAYALFGSEPRRPAERKPGMHGSVWWLAFGGKIEPVDEQMAWRTAQREFHEESGRCYLGNLNWLEQCFDQRAKYVLFFAQIPYLEQLPCFSGEDALRDSTLNKRELRWLPLDDILFSLDASQEPHLLIGSERLPVKSWFFEFLRRERHRLRRQKNLLVTKEQ